MVALDSSAPIGRSKLVVRLRFDAMGPLVAGIAVIGMMVVAAAWLARDFSENGFRLGSQWAWRHAFFVFFAALAAGPVARIIARFLPHLAPPQRLCRKLIWGFCASYGVYLLSVFLPDVIHPSAGATLMVLFGGGVVLAMALTAAPLKQLGRRQVWEKARRAVQTTAFAYFWLIYSLMALARLSGPHRPDAFYGTSLCLMVTGFLLCFADRWLSDHRRPPEPEQIVSNLPQPSVSK